MADPPSSHGPRYALVASDVHKRYGKRQALSGLSLRVPQGSITGLVGPNGAGKTTAFSIFAGLVFADSGTVDILGQGPFDPARHAGRVSVVPQDAELAPYTSVLEILVHFARLSGLSKARAELEAERALALVGLEERAHSKMRHLSHGMKKRVALAQALVGDPELVFLDEPTNGLDPELLLEVRSVILRQKGLRTLLVSSHHLAELEQVCDHVIFMQAGRAVLSGSMAELTRRAARVSYRLEEPVLVEVPGLEVELSQGLLCVEGPEGMPVWEVNRRVLPRLLELNARVLEVRAGRSLEAAYLDTRAKGLPRAPKAP
jgi:ABC-2 type transport system ATP-binding protein